MWWFFGWLLTNWVNHSNWGEPFIFLSSVGCWTFYVISWSNTISFQQKAKAPKTQSIIKRLKFRWKDWIEGCSNWWFGSRWFRILGVPLSNHPFHEGIPCIQTTGPKTTNKPFSDLKPIETRQLLGTKTFSEKVILVTIPIVFFCKTSQVIIHKPMGLTLYCNYCGTPLLVVSGWRKK